VRRILLWVNLLTVLLVVGQTAVAVCQGIPAAAPTTPPCVPPFDILKPDTPKKAFNYLMAGNARFASGKALRPNQCPWGTGQTPFAAILSCSDARVPPEILFDTGNNQLFLVRVAGNTAGNPQPEAPPLDEQNSLMFQSLEYAVNTFSSVRLLLVLGHTSCGAVIEALKGCPGSTSAITQNICPAIPPGSTDLGAAIIANVVTQVNLLKGTDPFAGRIRANTLAIVGGVYDIATGQITWVTPTP
jgi:carbonic anhydrase